MKADVWSRFCDVTEIDLDQNESISGSFARVMQMFSLHRLKIVSKDFKVLASLLYEWLMDGAK